jgi:hypothetical protein
MRYTGYATEQGFKRYNGTSEGDLQKGVAPVYDYKRLKRAEAEANAKNKPAGLRLISNGLVVMVTFVQRGFLESQKTL